MAKRKRPRYGNPERQARLMVRKAAGGPGGSFNRLARTSCGECGSAIEWITVAEADDRGFDLQGAKQFLGIDAIADGDVWACLTCDNFGVMGPTEKA